MESDDKYNKEQKVFRIKTFTVPFSLEKIKENMHINTHTSSNPSKETIITKAFQFHSEGNISEASKYYQYFINQGFKDHRVFSNYGSILKDLGKSKEAANLLRKAITINPKFAAGHYNLGNMLKEMGKSKEAILCYKESLLCYKEEINSDKNIDKVKNNLGDLLLKNGNLKEGLLYIREANGSIILNYKKSSIIIN
ncbi:tetratricopeptide repeat protein [Prochlorococcus sp. MIT 0801]|uniref:tetratricopeptide repeat protein n=1 Tax=Prochlorococcus sp. MIT 0801 TaxID=1501269 RepID=UPI0004F81558|nr:tetratricopeptide repeat protein [Prochlorococcus sp. MIT 0801]AIQ98129.1 Translation elongation factor P [Prochlorococcus sp. MIT 0801]